MRKYGLSTLSILLLLIAVFQFSGGLKIAAKAWLSQYLIEQAWLRTLSGQEKVRPWSWADTWPVAEIKVPDLDLKQVVLSGDSGAVLAFGPGMRNYYDEGLRLGFTIVSGHRDTHFRFLQDIRLNDIFEFKEKDGRSRQYQVLETKVVDENWSFPKINDDLEHLLILATCYPFESLSSGTDKRFLVFAVPVNQNV